MVNSRKSAAWKHFDPVDGDPRVLRCRYCSMVSRNTQGSNLKRHLNSHHRNIAKKVEKEDENPQYGTTSASQSSNLEVEPQCDKNMNNEQLNSCRLDNVTSLQTEYAGQNSTAEPQAKRARVESESQCSENTEMELDFPRADIDPVAETSYPNSPITQIENEVRLEPQPKHVSNEE